MASFLIRELSNGWVLQGPRDKTPFGTGNDELFLPTILAVAEVLTTWQLEGFVKAAAGAKEKYGGKRG